MKKRIEKMKIPGAAVLSLFLLVSACNPANQEKIPAESNASPVAPDESPKNVSVTRRGSQPSNQGAAENFTGSVKVDSLITLKPPSRLSGGLVSFEPGARSAWHSHPLGQNLIVTSGTGWVQQWGEPIQEIREGDAVWIPPGRKHWHGATATTAMSHIALVEQLDGKSTDWMEKVSDEQYRSSVK
jgi:quercetin dioxygenase-like cupin family protein